MTSIKAFGIDIGSLTTKVAILDSENIVYSDITTSSDDSETSVREAIGKALNQANLSLDDIYIVSTGAGSKFTSLCQCQKAITGCLARGIHYIFPSVRIVMDMGAETSTVIKINKRGRLSDWAGQDKCAAGAGIFLQQMSKLMQMPMEDDSILSSVICDTGHESVKTSYLLFKDCCTLWLQRWYRGLLYYY